MFGEQSMRLLRKLWANPTELAEELYAMLQDSVPLTHKAPLTLQTAPEETKPALTINNYGDGPMIRFVGKNNQGQGGINNQGELVDEEGMPPVAPAKKKEKAVTEVYAGKVVSRVAADKYVMTIYEDDGVTSIGDVEVKQLRIDASDSIPINAVTLVVKRGEKYFMQFPVWLEKPTT